MKSLIIFLQENKTNELKEKIKKFIEEENNQELKYKKLMLLYNIPYKFENHLKRGFGRKYFFNMWDFSDYCEKIFGLPTRNTHDKDIEEYDKDENKLIDLIKKELAPEAIKIIEDDSITTSLDLKDYGSIICIYQKEGIDNLLEQVFKYNSKRSNDSNIFNINDYVRIAQKILNLKPLSKKETEEEIKYDIEDLVDDIFGDCLEAYVKSKKMSLDELDFFYYNYEKDNKDLENIKDIIDEFKKSRIKIIKSYKEEIGKLEEYIISKPKLVIDAYRKKYEEHVQDGTFAEGWGII